MGTIINVLRPWVCSLSTHNLQPINYFPVLSEYSMYSYLLLICYLHAYSQLIHYLCICTFCFSVIYVLLSLPTHYLYTHTPLDYYLYTHTPLNYYLYTPTPWFPIICILMHSAFPLSRYSSSKVIHYVCTPSYKSYPS